MILEPTFHGNKCVAHSTYHVIPKPNARNALWRTLRHTARRAHQFIDERLYRHPTRGGNVDTCL
jgi:hypothetical protein